MADLVFNIAKGRVVELYNRVKSNDPANSAFVVVPVTVGAVTDATLRDCDTLAAVLAVSGVVERTTNGWTRKTITDAALATLPAPDDVNDRYDIDLPDQTWTTVASGGGATSDLIICYDANTTAGTDSDLIPCTLHDFVTTPSGVDVVAQFAAAGFYRAA